MYEKPKIAVDVDGIFTDFDAHWQQCAERVLGRSVPRVSEAHCLRERYGLNLLEYNQIWRAYNADEWHRLPVYPHAADLIRALEDLGGEVWAVTSVDPRHQIAREHSLTGLIQRGRIVCVGETGHECATPYAAKAAVLRHLGAVAFLDDHPANVNAAIGVTALAVLLDRGYQGLEAPEYGATVIDDVMDFPVLVDTFLRRTRRGVA
ncbi:hypothetical protein RU820_05925 [Acidithiobacillus ferrooxidans]|uniref:hypothetical protein n=1 Tax=Acidithiobacillus TaxID=119977 RepID=UPI0002F7427C|nr:MULTISPECIES: hypothetical protein [Acidithiobacillus]MBN6745540.1 hypothetical protein [Acidithiobacillus sp. MC2.2]MBN6748433.1 hypothetical protein [Acidithiobacillus sp. PG05]